MNNAHDEDYDYEYEEAVKQFSECECPEGECSQCMHARVILDLLR